LLFVSARTARGTVQVAEAVARPARPAVAARAPAAMAAKAPAAVAAAATVQGATVQVEVERSA
jgi:hypothetical protein